MTNDQPVIAVVEDDAEIRTLLRDYLNREGFRVREADGGAMLDKLIATHGTPDLIVLDIMLPGEDGLSICRRITALSAVPVIMLTARGDEIDRIVGLEIGADDYMSKPFNPRELVARIRAILRRNQPKETTGREIVKVGALTVDLSARTVLDEQGEPIELTSGEFALFACFISRPNRVLTRDQLMDWTRGRQAEAFDRAVDVQVSRLRKKLSTDTSPIIKTIRNEGYLLTANVSPAKGSA